MGGHIGLPTRCLLASNRAKTDVYTHAEVSQQLPHPQIPKPSSLRGLEPITEPPVPLGRDVPGKSLERVIA